MRIRTWLLFLIGDRRAILDLAADRRTLWVGLLFVLSAGLAREYDGEDLLHEPWHLLLPLGASLVSSFVLFGITGGLAKVKDPSGPPFSAAYFSFLGLFWMTAPLAWLYAVPYERFLSPAGATAANLWTLGIVSAWRVLLMVRVVWVVMGYGLVSALVLVLLFADAVALTVLSLVPLPILDLMGGIRLSESERMIRDVACGVQFWGTCSLPLWIIGALIVAARSKPAWQGPLSVSREGIPPGRSLFGLAVVALAAGVVVLPLTQPEQQRRRRVERDLRAGRLTEALAEMSRYSRDDFPAHWDPPPRPAYRQEQPPIVDLIEAMAESPPAPWVQTLFLQKLEYYLRYRHFDPKDVPRVAASLKRLPDGVDFVEGLTTNNRGPGRPGNHRHKEMLREHMGLPPRDAKEPPAGQSREAPSP